MSSRFAKKLLFITDMFPSAHNPVSGIFVQQQVEALTKLYRVRVISTWFPDTYSQVTEHAAGYPITYVRFPASPHGHIFSLLSYYRYALPVIRAILEQFQPDLIQVHDCRHLPELLLLKPVLIKQNIPLYLTLHNLRTHPDSVTHLNWLYGRALQPALTGWTHIFTVNDRLAAQVLPFLDSGRITVLGNAIPPAEPAGTEALPNFRTLRDKDRTKLISVGNLTKTKGFDLLIRATNILSDKGYDLNLTIIGAGDQRPYLSSLIKSLKLDDRILLTGAVANQTVRNLYPLADIFVLPSYSETFGIVYLEAMAAGLPVIGVRGQGIDGVVKHGENGLLVKPRDVDDLVAQIEWLLSNHRQAAQLAECGRQLVESQYLMPRLIERIVQVYERP